MLTGSTTTMLVFLTNGSLSSTRDPNSVPCLGTNTTGVVACFAKKELVELVSRPFDIPTGNPRNTVAPLVYEETPRSHCFEQSVLKNAQHAATHAQSRRARASARGAEAQSLLEGYPLYPLPYPPYPVKGSRPPLARRLEKPARSPRRLRQSIPSKVRPSGPSPHCPRRRSTFDFLYVGWQSLIQ